MITSRIFFTLLACLISFIPAHAQAEAVRLKAGDQLQIEIFSHDDMTATVPVEATGEASFRFLDPFKVEGMTLKEVRGKVTEAYKGDYFVNPEVTIRVAELAKGTIRVMGAVTSPKDILLERGKKLSVSEAIASAGGTTELADRTNITLRSKDGKKRRQLNLNKLQAQGAKSEYLQDGDSLEVGVNPNAGKIITIMGEITNPGNEAYPLQGGMTLERLIGIRGGVKLGGVKEGAIITRGGRKFPNSGMQTLLLAGDAVTIPRNPNIGKFITMGGLVQKPGQIAMPLNGKITVSQAIAAAGGKAKLGDLRKIVITRKAGNRVQTIKVNLKNVRDGKEQDILLRHGDTVAVKERIL